ncbi:MAG: hypothetical protein LBC75_01060 [Fibromonadaceae bacterium]|jgi:signal recognition particle GTPase|nr:hypothetical protein [Fibromonadaceae bacterium]
MKIGRPLKYKTDKERKEAIKKSERAYYRRNRKKIKAKAKSKKYKEYQKEYQKNRYERIKKVLASKDVDTSALEKRITELETEQKEILLTLEEVLKDNKRLENLIKWGGKK